MGGCEGAQRVGDGLESRGLHAAGCCVFRWMRDAAGVATGGGGGVWASPGTAISAFVELEWQWRAGEEASAES